jgi:cytoskeletal protein CcmA (bactofilin family)
MAATTNNYGFPYPQDSDTVDVAGDIQSLAEDIDTKLSEAIADTVGTMVTSNTESGISVTYDDADNTLDFDVADFTLTFLGDVSGSASINNLASASATITIAPNSVALGTDTTGNYVATAAAGTGIDIAGSGSETADLTITNTGVISLAGTADEITVSASAGAVTLSLPATINANTTGTAAALATSRTIELTGDVTGTVSFDGSASASIATTIAANSVSLGTDTTGNYVATVAGTNNEIEVSGSGSESATITIGLPDNVTISNDLTVTGNLIVSGSTAYINTTELLVEDNLVTLNSGTTGSPTLNAGIEIERGTSANTSIRWNESTDVWEFTNDGTNYYTIKDFDTALGTKTTDNLTQGSTNLYFTDERAQDAISTAIAAGTQTNITVSYNDSTNSFSFISVDPGVTSLLGTADEVTVSASAGAVTLSLPATINANTTGTAAALTTARTIALTGDVTGTVSFDGSASASMATTIAANSVALGTDTTGNYIASVSGTANEIEVSGSGEGATVTVGLTDNVSITGDLTVGGNLTISGSATYINAETIQLADNTIVLNSNVTESPTENSGIEVERGTSANVSVLWNEANDQWTLTNDGTNYGAISRKVAASVGNASGTSFAVVHNLGTRDVTVNVYDNANYETVVTDVVRTDANTVTVSFATAPSSNAYRVVVVG